MIPGAAHRRLEGADGPLAEGAGEEAGPVAPGKAAGPNGGPPAAGGGAPAAEGGRVVWRELTLWGFGPFRGPVRVTFPEGLGVWVAPNETGKSTLVAGLVAVLFGLPGSSDPLKYGQARYRHWHGADRFQGELLFTATDGCHYRVRRDFTTHRVWLVRQGPQGPVVEWEGTHNPGANRPARAYEERIGRLVGIGSRGLLLQTFCVQQPLPPPGEARRESDTPALDAEVQRLLAGAGASSPAAALDHLLDQVRQRTRNPGQWGLSIPSLRRDRQWEELEGRIGQLEEAIRRDVEAADQLERVRRRRAELAEERLALQRQLARQERLIQAWQEWRRLTEQYRHRVHRRVEMDRALQRARELQGALAAGRRQLAAQWPHWAHGEAEAAPDPGPDLDRLVALEQSLGQVEQRARSLGRRRLEAQARSLLAAWQRYRWLSAAVAAGRRRLDDHPLLAGAGFEERQRLRRAEAESARLDHQVEAAQRELAALEEAWRGWEDEARRLDEAYADVARWTEAMAAAAEEKPLLLERHQRWQAEVAEAEGLELQRRRAAGRAALVAAALAGLAAAALGREAGWTVPLLVALAAAVALAAGWGVHRWLVRSVPAAAPAALAQEGRRLEERLQQVDAALGPWAQTPPEELQALARRYREWAARRQALEERRSQLPEPQERARRQEQLEEARRRREEWRRWLAPFRQRYGDPAAALARWEEEERRWQALQESLEAFCRQEWGVAAPEVPGLPCQQAGGPWAEVAAAVAEGGGPGPNLTVADLAAWLETFDPAFWQEPEQEAVRWAAWRRGWGLAAAEAGPAGRPGPADGSASQPGPVPWSWAAGGQVAAAALEADPLRPGEAAGPGPAAARAADESLVRFISDQRGGAALAAAEEEQLQGQAAALAREVEALRQRLALWLEPVGGDARAAREAWTQWSRHRQVLREQERELKGLLASWQVDDVDGLAARMEQERDGALLARRELEELVQRHPGLPPVDGPEAPAVDDLLDRWTADAERLRERLASLAADEDQLRQREAELTRAEPINVAAAELELAQLKEQRETLREEIRALVLAYQELQAAVQEYHATYRRRLEQAASGYFARMTGRPGRRITVDEAFRIGVREPDGTGVLPGQLSQGARDQLYWSLRLAVADLLADDVRLPFLLDDPFVHCDPERLQRIRSILEELAREGQILLFSHRHDLAGWGVPVTVDGTGGQVPGGERA